MIGNYNDLLAFELELCRKRLAGFFKGIVRRVNSSRIVGELVRSRIVADRLQSGTLLSADAVRQLDSYRIVEESNPDVTAGSTAVCFIRWSNINILVRRPPAV